MFSISRAFKGPDPLDWVIIHELAHGLCASLSSYQKDDYEKSMGWKYYSPERELLPREGGFVRADGNESPQEDFANNIEAFLVQPEHLKEITPKAVKWISKNFSSKFQLKDVCAREK